MLLWGPGPRNRVPAQCSSTHRRLNAAHWTHAAQMQVLPNETHRASRCTCTCGACPGNAGRSKPAGSPPAVGRPGVCRESTRFNPSTSHPGMHMGCMWAGSTQSLHDGVGPPPGSTREQQRRRQQRPVCLFTLRCGPSPRAQQPRLTFSPRMTPRGVRPASLVMFRYCIQRGYRNSRLQPQQPSGTAATALPLR